MSRVEDLVCNLQKVVKCFLVKISTELQTAYSCKPNMFHYLEGIWCWLELLTQISGTRSDLHDDFFFLKNFPKKGNGLPKPLLWPEDHKPDIWREGN